MTVEHFQPKIISIEEIFPHPQNYRKHPEDQLQHLVESIKEHGIYRNIIIAKDNIILAGHGVVEACKKMELKAVPVIQLDIESQSPQALKILTGDNEISHLGEIDDRMLSEILRDIKVKDINGLLGTGYDEKMLANLVMVTRPASEIANINEAKEWVGMPDYEEENKCWKAVINFDTIEERHEFIKQLDFKNVNGRESDVCSLWWPDREREDPSSVIVEG